MLKNLALTLAVTFAVVSQTSVARETASNVELNLLGGLTTISGDYGGTFLAGVSFQVDRSSALRLGIDSGLMFGSGTGLPILPTLYFPLGAQGGRSRAYLGASVGPVIGLDGLGYFNKGLTGDSVKLAILARPGLMFDVADALSVKTELIFGGLTGIFYITPSIGLGVHL